MEQSNPTVTIGVAIRYEQPDNLRRFVRQLSDAAHLLDEHTESEVYFCLNGGSQETQQFLKDALRDLHDPELHFNYLESPPGKIRAQEVIAQKRKLNGFLLFADADILFEKTLFLRMYEFLMARPEVQACYADVTALPSVAGGVFGRLQNAYYSNRHKLPQRAHLHGRCFMLRNWVDGFGERCSPTKTGAIEPDATLDLPHGPIVDDIHYSRVLVHQFGRSSIAMVPDTHVHFVPPHSAKELYRDSCRTEFELFRLNILFPEHASIEREVFQQKSQARNRGRALLNLGPQASIYRLIEHLMRRIARFKVHKQIASLSEGGINPSDTIDTAAKNTGKDKQMS